MKLQLIVFLLILSFSVKSYALPPIKENFCHTSPFISSAIEPNVVVVMDYSGSMQIPAYSGCDTSYYAGDLAVCNNGEWKCTRYNRGQCVGHWYWDISPEIERITSPENTNEYDRTEDYYGYFDSEAFYSYSNDHWLIKTDCSITEKTDGTCIHGNLLNWISTTRTDATLKALIGGKAESCDSNENGYCYLTTQGAGSKWIDDTNLNCRFEVRACTDSSCDSDHDEDDGSYADHKWYLKVSDNANCAIGTFGYRELKVKVPKSERIGVVQKNFDKVRFTLINYRSSEENGKIVHTVNNTELQHLIDAFENDVPKGGTPSNIALDEAYDYLSQINSRTNSGSGGYSYSHEDNSAFIHRNDNTTGVDPYYGFFSGKWKPTRCRNSYVLFISDGLYNSGGDPDDVAHDLHTNDLRNDLDAMIIDGKSIQQHAKVYSLFAFDDGTAGIQSMKTIAVFGGYEDNETACSSDIGTPYLFSENTASETNSTQWDACDNRTGAPNAGNIDECCKEWDRVNNADPDNESAPVDGIPDNFFHAVNGTTLETALSRIFSNISKSESASTSVATVTTQRRESSMAFQAYFHPATQDDDSDKQYYWTGKLRSFYTDFKSNMREETDTTHKLNLKSDKIITFDFNEIKGKTFSYIIDDDDGDGIPDDCSTPTNGNNLSDISPIWDAAKNLSDMSDPGNTRLIVFNHNLTKDSTMLASNENKFITSNAEQIAPYWDNQTDLDFTRKLIRFIQGYDYPYNDGDFRRRSFSTNTSQHAENVEKLGDIVNSTPRVITPTAQDHYNAVYGDTSYLKFIASDKVTERKSVLIVGSNDGMLHGFNAGKIVSSSRTDGEAAKVINDFNDKDLGDEVWAFIPKNSLPYLRWYHLEDREKHIPKIDYRYVLLDASINGSSADTKDKNSWRTVLIGMMGFGGEAIDVDNDGIDDYSSSIFVIDVTDPESPKFMWEESLPDRTLVTSAPAITRYGNQDKEGDWQIVFGSGPIDPYAKKFSALAKLFSFNLRDGTSTETEVPFSSNMAVGDLLAVDVDFDYQTDAVYFGLYGEEGEEKGSLRKLQVRDGNNYDKFEFENILDTEAPVFASPEVALDDHGKLWTYVGTGRFFNDDDKVDTVQQRLFGIVDINETWKGSNSYSTTEDSSITKDDLFDSTTVEVIASVKKVECACNGVLTGKTAQFVTDHYECCSGTCFDQIPIITEVENDKIICSSEKTFGVESLAEKITCYSGSGCISSTGCSTSGTIGLEGWYLSLGTKERIYSKPFLAGSIIDVLTYIPDDDVCSFGGDSSLKAVYYKTGTPGFQPMFLSSDGTYDEDFSATSRKAKMQSSVSLGKGAPPYGESITALSPEEGSDKFTKMVQTSTGAVMKQKQQAKGLTNKKLFQITR